MLESWLTTARRAARTASALCLAVLEESPERPDAMAKSGAEPVTVADYGSQAVILEAVAAEHPRHRIVAEEGSEHFRRVAGPEAAEQIVRLVGAALDRPVGIDDVLGWIGHAGGGEQPTWAIDPIDGTKGFLRRDQFAVAIGLISGRRAIGGVLGCPNLDTGGRRGVLFWGGEGIGAFAEPLDGGLPVPIATSSTASPGGVRVLGSVEAAHGDPALVRAVMAAGGLGGGMVRIDSQVKYGAIASGLAEVYLRPRNRPEYRERIWDHAAGTAIVTAAGGRVTDLDGAELDFSLGSRLEANRGVLATNGHVHDLVLDALRAAEGSGAAPPGAAAE